MASETSTSEFNIEITKLDEAPDDWPFEKIEINVTAPDDEAAEGIAEGLIGLLHKQWDEHSEDQNPVNAMEVNEVYEV